MQRTTLVAIAAALGLGLGVGAGFLAAQSPSESTRLAESMPSPTQSAAPDPSPSVSPAPDREASRPERQERPRESDRTDASTPRSPSVQSLLAFDAQATHCPTNGGGGNLISLYMTDDHLIYICQGGEGRADWRELDYYAVNRAQPDEWIRLRAFVTSGPGVYAENGAYRYEIDPASLTVRENSSILLQEPVLRCKGNCS